MESSFHAVLPKKWVIHFHSLPSVLMAHRHFSARTPKLQTSRSIAWIPECVPGLTLTQKILPHVDAEIFILSKHGVILQGDSPSILKEWMTIERTFCEDYEYLGLLKWQDQPLLRHARSQPLPRFKPLWPDAALYANDIQSEESHFQDVVRSAEEAKDVSSMTRSFDRKKKDLFEIWLATVIALQTEPDLEVLDADQAVAISNLPTEKFRRQQ